MENVLVVGSGQLDEIKLGQFGCKVVGQWERLPDDHVIPNNIDRVVLLSDGIDIFSVKAIHAECEQNLIPLTFTKASLDNFEEAIKRSDRKVLCDAVVNSGTNLEGNMDKQTEDGRVNGRNHQRLLEKISYLRELLTADKTAATEDLAEKVRKKFGSGIAPTAISNVRWDEFGVKFGPRGKLITKDGSTIDKADKGEKISRPNRKADNQAGNDRLTKLLAMVRQEMARTSVSRLEIPRQGAAQATYEVTREFGLQ